VSYPLKGANMTNSGHKYSIKVIAGDLMTDDKVKSAGK